MGNIANHVTDIFDGIQMFLIRYLMGTNEIGRYGRNASA